MSRLTSTHQPVTLVSPITTTDIAASTTVVTTVTTASEYANQDMVCYSESKLENDCANYQEEPVFINFR